ncbi:MAG: hypothetical protein KJO07_10295 [Deltaproteobacteria bacterium]|nr:hypothetical protein [Deltaproteobacteria bacterium]
MLRTTTVLAALIAALGCDSTVSSDLTNDELRLFAHADVDELGNLDVVAQITTDNPALLEETFVDLIDGDALSATLDGEEVTMAREWVPIVGLIQYRAQFESVGGGEILSIDLERPSYGDIEDSWVEIPPPFELSMPASFSRSDYLVVEWTPVPATRSGLSLSGSCFDDSFQMDGNPGRIELAPPRLSVPEGVDAQAQCELDATLTVVNERSAAAGFGRGGRITAEQVRRSVVESTP